MYKKLYFFFFLLIFCFTSNAQSWKPFYKGDTTNFKYNNSVIVSHTIWVDSAKFVSGDSVFYLNRVFLNCDTCLHIPGYLNCDTCFALDNQPQFLQRKIIKKDNGRYLLNDTSNLEIRTLAKLNDSWLFDAARGITATVVNTSLQIVFGLNDSVKTIRLSNSDTIKLSKSFGFIQFPNLYGAGNYKLVGIENRHKGEKVPGFWEIFNFNVGDVFQYFGRYTNGGMNEKDEYVKKYYIISKTITSDKFIYYVHRIQKGKKYPLSPPSGGVPYVYNDYLNIEYNKNGQNPPYNYEPDKIVNRFSNYKFTTLNCFKHYSYITLITVDSLNIITKKVGAVNPPNMGINKSYLPYTIPGVYYVTMGSVIDGAAHGEYKVGLGRTSVFVGCFEIDRYEFLEGYIKNGDTVGVITPDGTLLGLPKPESSIMNKICIFPNPFSENTLINIKENAEYPCTLTVFNCQGQLVRTETINSKDFMFKRNQLTCGIYIIKVLNNEQNLIGYGKLIIQN